MAANIARGNINLLSHNDVARSGNWPRFLVARQPGLVAPGNRAIGSADPCNTIQLWDKRIFHYKLIFRLNHI